MRLVVVSGVRRERGRCSKVAVRCHKSIERSVYLASCFTSKLTRTNPPLQLSNPPLRNHQLFLLPLFFHPLYLILITTTMILSFILSLPTSMTNASFTCGSFARTFYSSFRTFVLSGVGMCQ